MFEIAKETGELAAKARDGKLGPADMCGGCFSISSLGGIGGTAFTPIVNAPGGGDPRRVEIGHETGLGRQGLPAAPDAAAEPEL